MAKLTPKKRSSLPKKDFAGPGRSYPVENAAHAKAAEMEAGIAWKKGRMSAGEKNRIDAKARKTLKGGTK